MKIFEKRPLALILCIMLGGFSLFVNFDIITRIIIASVSLLLIGIIFIFDNLKFGRRPLFVISLIAFSLSLALSTLWSFVFFPTDLFDTEVSVSGLVYDVDNSSSSSTTLICKTSHINDKKDKHTIVVYLDKKDGVYIEKYDVISFNAELSAFSSYDDGFDGKSYYISKGYSGYAENVEELLIIDNKTDKLHEFFSSLQLKISNLLKLRTNYETGAFLSALIVGNRNDLSGNTRLNFTRLGISHILALSGMHLAILSMAFNTVLSKFGVKKKLRVTLLILLIVFYICLTGFSPSVLRSGIMLIISSVLYLLSNKADPMTSLFIAVTVIVAFDPSSVYDVSLWLSAFATLGVIVFSEISLKADRDASKKEKLFLLLKNGCLVSVFALCPTFMFTAMRFNGISLISVFSTLIFSFLIQFLIYAGFIILFIGGFIPVGGLVILFSDAVLYLAQIIANAKFIYASIGSPLVKIAVTLLSVFFFAFLLFDVKNKRKSIIILLIMLCGVLSISEADTLISRFSDDVIYSPSKSGDTLLVKSQGDVYAVYSGKAFADDSWDVLDLFIHERITYLDGLIFASYSYSTIDFSESILSSVKVERIFLPTPTTKDEINQAEGLSELLYEFGAELKFYDLMENVYLGDVKYSLFDKADYTYGTYPSNVYKIQRNTESVTYISACEYDNISPSAKALIYNSEKIIVGSIGNSNYYRFDIHVPVLNELLYYDDYRVDEFTAEYYNKKGASMQCIKTPVSIFS